MSADNRCSRCGAQLYDGMVWQGRKHTWCQWLEEYGPVCGHCLGAAAEAGRQARRKEEEKERQKKRNKKQ